MFIPPGLFFSIFNNSIMFMKGLRFALLSLKTRVTGGPLFRSVQCDFENMN